MEYILNTVELEIDLSNFTFKCDEFLFGKVYIENELSISLI